jgi:hypothetical protein
MAENPVPLGTPERRLLGGTSPLLALIVNLIYISLEINLVSGEVKVYA